MTGAGLPNARLIAVKDVFDAALPASEAADRLRQFAIPGDPATRSRWFFLLDTERPPLHRGQILLTDLDSWVEDIELENRADSLQTGLNDSPALWQSLRSRERQPVYQIITVNALLGLADHYRRAEQRAQSYPLLDEAVRMAESFNYRYGVMRTHLIRGHLELIEGHTHDASVSFRASLSLAGSLGDPLFQGNSSLGLAHVALAKGNRKLAAAHARRALRRFTRVGSAIGIANAHSVLGTTQGEEVDSRDTDSESSTTMTDVVGRVERLLATGDRHAAEGRVPDASEAYVQAKTIAEGNYPRGEANSWAALGRILESSPEPGAADLAEKAHYEALKLFTQIDDRVGLAYTHVALSSIAMGRGATTVAMDHDEAAIVTIENLLNTDPRAASQDALSERFSTVYLHAVRNALAADRPDSLLMALENLAGRRLSGVSAVPASGLDTWLTSGLAAISAEAASGRRPSGIGTTGDRQKEVMRRLGRIGLRMAIPDIARRTLEDAITGVHRPITRARLAELVSRLPESAQVLVVATSPGAPDDIVWWHRSSHGEARIGTSSLGAATSDFVDRLVREGIPPGMHRADMESLATLIPDFAREDITGKAPLILIPLGRLSSVPWPAVPVGDRFLAELTPFVRCPTLSLYVAADSRPKRVHPRIPSISIWRNPTVRFARFGQVEHDSRRQATLLNRADEVRAVLNQPDADVVAVACHGRTTPGIGHYLDLGGQVYLTPGDCATANPPDTVALVSCWGAASPHLSGRDPLSIPNILLARGSRAVLATTSELGRVSHMAVGGRGSVGS
ncbi:hypothetical protein M1C59_25855 (plasmid) [Gordonia terrae]|uniref:hypothetical protein n=1 Tax=Gordonia terrae TaxID=2055 RepID=UPI00200AC6E1|nr:hypothetical protein [Gordonia terrae]UPW11984.1 hypothetical protein M1C59_25855 [Gordonia terrae]